MAGPPDQYGYQTPVMDDAERAYRRLLRFQIKMIVVVLLVGAVVAAAVAAVVLTREESRTTVPNVVGFDNVGVASTFERAHLATDFLRFERASTSVPIGRVVTTDPPPGTRVKRGSVVRVTFSCGAPTAFFCAA